MLSKPKNQKASCYHGAFLFLTLVRYGIINTKLYIEQFKTYFLTMLFYKA